MHSETKRSLLRAIKVVAAMFALAIIALAPAFVASILAPDPMSDDGGINPQVSAVVEDETDVVETVLVIDPKADDVIGDEFTATKDADDDTEERYFTIIAEDVTETDVFDGSEFITITLGDSSSDGRSQRTWIDSGCRIYVGPYDSQDAERSGLYSAYEGSVKVLDEESRSISDDCTLYWIDAEAEPEW